MNNKVKDEFRIYNIVKVIILLSPILMVTTLHNYIDNDTYWIIKTGEYISKYGIPAKDFLTMHTNMDLVCQQWLSSVIIYKITSWFGYYGLLGLQGVMFVVIGALMYRLSYIVSKNRFAGFIVVFAYAFFANSYIVTRPQIFTYALVLVELICLEKYVKTGKLINLVPLPIISALIVNLHASMWTMIFIVMLPYLVNALPIKIKGKSLSCCKILPLIITTIIMGAFGLITPYGIKGLTFIFTTSIGDKVNSSIMELSPFTVGIGNVFELVVILVVIAFYVYFLRFTKNTAPIRYHLLICGLFLMGMLYIKLFAYFAIAGASISTFLFFDYKLKIKDKFKDKKFALVIGIEMIIVVLAVIFASSFAVDIMPSDNTNNSAGEISYIENLSEICDELDKEDKENMILYNGFNSGGYLEFRGYTTYIDARADSFVIEANHDFDYLTEYFDSKNGNIYYKDFYNKYKFTHFVIEKGVSPYLYSTTSHDDDYELIYENDSFALFKTKIN